MTDKLIHIDNEYKQWIADICQRFRQSQIKAAVKVNSEMLRFYWSLGKDIADQQFENKYGSRFYERLSLDLSKDLQIKKGFAPTSLRYTKYFYCLYAPLFENHRQPAEESGNKIYRQDAEDFELLFSIPWTHHQKIIDRVKGNAQKAMFFVRKTWENQWGRGMLMNFLDTDLYERQGAAQTNFKATLPAAESDLAQQMLKDPYRFEFVQIHNEFSEKDLKDELINKISHFLLELGRGFSFVGREYRISAGGKDKFIDLLFYIIPLHRYCVVEVKITEFDFQDVGQLAGYTAMVDDLLNVKGDNPSIGLLICKEKNTVLAHYALSRIATPIGISSYQIAQQQLPDELKETLPSIEEIERELSSKS